MKRILAAVLAIVMAMSVAVCGVSTAAAEEPRTITIATWWDMYYDSTHESPEDNPAYSGTVAEQMQFDVVKKVEEKFNVRIEYVNLTFEGVKDSINTSILAGTPDCDIYLVDVQFGIPAALSGLGTDLKAVLPEDADVLADQTILSYLDLGDGKATLFGPVSAQSRVENTTPLAFNVQLLEDNNLEDPRELWERGEWTWDKFVEYCQVLTQDTDGDGVNDQFGVEGFGKDILRCLLLSNGATIAGGPTETLSSAPVGEAMQFLSDLFNVYKVAKPYVYEEPWNIHRFGYRDGNVGFWPAQAWFFGNNNDYDWDGTSGTTLDFDTAFVQWPIGPSGDAETNYGKVTTGNRYMIPAGVEDPALVYEVFEALTNWYEDDTELRDDPEQLLWWYTVHAKDEDLQEENFNVMFEMGARDLFDIWDACGIEMDMDSLIRGDMTAAQMQESHRQQYQDALDQFFG